MITTHLRNLLTAVICIFAGATAQAQFTGGVEQYPTSDYSQKAVKFSLTEVATQVGTDAATLAEAYNAWLGEEEPAENLFFLVQPNRLHRSAKLRIITEFRVKSPFLFGYFMNFL